MAYACPRCRRFYRIKKNGVFVEEGMPARVPDGSTVWQPYKLWSGDLYECEGCGAQLHVPARAALAEHYQPDYANKVEQYQPICRIDDCPGLFNEERAFNQRASHEVLLAALKGLLDEAVAEGHDDGDDFGWQPAIRAARAALASAADASCAQVDKS